MPETSELAESYVHIKAQDGHVPRRRPAPNVTVLLVAGEVVIAVCLLLNLLVILLSEFHDLSARMDALASYEVYWEWRK